MASLGRLLRWRSIQTLIRLMVIGMILKLHPTHWSYRLGQRMTWVVGVHRYHEGMVGVVPLLLVWHHVRRAEEPVSPWRIGRTGWWIIVVVAATDTEMGLRKIRIRGRGHCVTHKQLVCGGTTAIIV